MKQGTYDEVNMACLHIQFVRLPRNNQPRDGRFAFRVFEDRGGLLDYVFRHQIEFKKGYYSLNLAKAGFARWFRAKALAEPSFPRELLNVRGYVSDPSSY